MTLLSRGFLTLLASGLLVAQTSVTTYHYDNRRTGWNPAETVLTPASAGSAAFGVLKTVSLDDQVDAQPLVVPNMQITAGSHRGLHDVVYVATEGNTVYVIDVHSGGVLLKPNFGTPVPNPQGCNNNGPNVGINSTPVIDLTSNTLYVMVYTLYSNSPTYFLHALDLGSLTDKFPARQVQSSHTLTDGSTYAFNAAVQRQRPGLLLANGTIYAGFGSFCDYAANLSRGWLLGWSAGSLQPLPSNQLFDTQSLSPQSIFLSSIWMSGYGLAADDEGNIMFVTGNSDKAGTTYDGVTDIQESVVKMSADLTTVVDIFTPQDQAHLDMHDIDFGSGGVMLLPEQPGNVPNLAVAAGKEGNLFLLDQSNLGGYSTVSNNVLGTYSIGSCWCGESYFVDPQDGLARVVSSGGNSVEVWKLQTAPAPSLTLVSSATGITLGLQHPGFFTSVSSNGSAAPIIWALSHPANSSQAPIFLYAFDPQSGGANLHRIFAGKAGVWPSTHANSNLVPVVANGQVFVASYKQLQIFGLKQ